MDGALTFIHICVNSSRTVLEHLIIYVYVYGLKGLMHEIKIPLQEL